MLDLRELRPHLGQCLLDPRLVALHHLQEGLSRQSTPHLFDQEWLHQGSDLHLALLLAGRRCTLQRLFQGLVSPLLASVLLQAHRRAHVLEEECRLHLQCRLNPWLQHQGPL